MKNSFEKKGTRRPREKVQRNKLFLFCFVYEKRLLRHPNVYNIYIYYFVRLVCVWECVCVCEGQEIFIRVRVGVRTNVLYNL